MCRRAAVSARRGFCLHAGGVFSYWVSARLKRLARAQLPSNLCKNMSAAFFLSSSTIVGSSQVEVSPKYEVSFTAIVRKVRCMICPLRVVGRALVNIWSDVAVRPTSCHTAAFVFLWSVLHQCLPPFALLFSPSPSCRKSHHCWQTHLGW